MSIFRYFYFLDFKIFVFFSIFSLFLLNLVSSFLEIEGARSSFCLEFRGSVARERARVVFIRGAGVF